MYIKKRALGTVIAFAMMTFSAQADVRGVNNQLAQPTPSSHFFYDTSSSHENYSAIRWLKFQGVVQGYNDGTYKPDAKINRAELTKIIIASEFDKNEIDNCKSTKTFTDVDPNEWYSRYICVAFNNNIIQGYNDGSFRPLHDITFAEAAKIITQSLKHQTPPDLTWYKPYVAKLEQEKAAPISIEKIDQEITRGEMAEIIFRLKDNVHDKPTTSFFVQNQNIIPPFYEKKGCDQNVFKMAFIVVTRPGTPVANQNTVQKLQKIATLFDKAFFKATRYLGKMETDTNMATIEITDDLLYSNSSTNPSQNTYTLNYAKVIKRFYETHPDNYDFVSIFPDDVNIGSSSSHSDIRNRIQNIGKDIQDGDIIGDIYGSKQRLLGFNEIIYNDSITEDGIMWLLLHETGHQWCCGINNSQLKIGDGSHMSDGVENPYRSALMGQGGSIYYSFNEKNSTFLAESNMPSSNLKYHPFSLYFMGLLPSSEYSTRYDVYDVAPYNTVNEEGIGKATFFKSISVNDIINASGLRSCKLSQ